MGAFLPPMLAPGVFRSIVEGCGSYTGKRVKHVCLKILPMLTQFEHHPYMRRDRCPVYHGFVKVPLE